MIDLRIIEIRDLLPVNKVEYANGVTPRSIYVRGLNFKNAHEVWINEVKSPSVVIVNGTTLLAQVPTSILDAAIRSVTVVSHRITGAKRSRIEFRIGDTTHLISGLERLIQTFVKLLLQTPGTDAFRPVVGGGLIAAAGKLSLNPITAANSVVADVQVAVSRTQQQLISLQANDSALSLSEKLLYAKLLEARFVPNEQALDCRIELANHEMQSGVVAMEV